MGRSLREHNQVIAQIVSELDQDWEEAKDWVAAHDGQDGILERITDLFVMDSEEFREMASGHEIDCFQRLARIAFWEAFKRIHETTSK